MALNKDLFRQLTDSGVAHPAALILADPSKDVVTGTAVTDPAAVTATAIAAANAVTPANAAYTVADQTALADLANELKVDLDALRIDLISVRTALTSLLTSLRDAGTLNT